MDKSSFNLNNNIGFRRININNESDENNKVYKDCEHSVDKDNISYRKKFYNKYNDFYKGASF